MHLDLSRRDALFWAGGVVAALLIAGRTDSSILVACSEDCWLTCYFAVGWKSSVFDRLTVPTVMPLLIKSTPVAR